MGCLDLCAFFFFFFKCQVLQYIATTLMPVFYSNFSFHLQTSAPLFTALVLLASCFLLHVISSSLFLVMPFLSSHLSSSSSLAVCGPSSTPSGPQHSKSWGFLCIFASSTFFEHCNRRIFKSSCNMHYLSPSVLFIVKFIR